MRHYEEHEIQRIAMLKVARARIREKYMIAADRECYERIPELGEQINAALLSGQALEIDLDTWTQAEPARIQA